MTLKELVSWVESQSVDKDSIDSITKFAKELNGKIGEINFSYSGNANAIWYSDEIEKTNLWVTVKNISDSNSDWYF